MVVVSESRFVNYTALFSTGERFPVLLYRDTYQPVILATRYVIDERRENSQSGIVSRDSRVLRWLYEWADVRKLNLEKRLRDGELLTKAEITSFCKYLRSRRSINVVGSIEARQRSEKRPSPTLSPETFNSYIGVVEGFLLWAAYEFVPVATPEGAIRDNLKSAITRVQRAFSSNRSSGQSLPRRCGLTDEEIREIREFIKPGAKRNPFKRSVQFRNWLIFELLLATGIRRGELLKLKLMHLPTGPKHTLSIVRSPDDKGDPRRNEPQVKTRMREVPLPSQLRVSLWQYVQKYRKTSRNNQYVFTSIRGGSPLDSGGVNWIFSSLAEERLSHLKGRFSPHVLRHTFNERLVELALSLGWPEDRIKNLQNYLNGWSDRSRMSTHYTRRVIEAEAMEIAERYQNSLQVF